MAVAVALQVPQAPGKSVRESLSSVLARQQLLVVLDNCEHVAGAAAELCEVLLAAADDVRVLATSRAPLEVAGESRYRLPPLALPGGTDGGAAEHGGASEAVALFADRGPPGGPAFRAHRRVRAGGGPAGGAAGRHAAGDRAGRGPGGVAGYVAAAGLPE
jgi:non-specific serine/threonine protein kinase